MMVAPSVSNAKNRMRKSVEAIVYPWPKDVQPIWDHFGSRCAYCDVDLDPKGRRAHMDHAMSGGGNHIGNLILSCAICNGDEKREEGWREFLERKVADEAVRARRVQRIEEWIALHPPPIYVPSPGVAALQTELDRMTDEFGLKCAELRKLVAEDRATQTARSVPGSPGSAP